MRRRITKSAAALLAAFCLLQTAGCGSGEPLKIVLTTGFQKDEVFRLEDVSCSRAELMVYLTTEQNRYEKVYGQEIWEAGEGGEELERRLKEKVLAEVSRIKAMTLLADRRGVTLDAEEEELAAKAAEQYYGGLNEAERSALDVDQERIRGMYRDYALADKVYRSIIGDINPEISDDEARTITVQHVLIRTVTENADGTVTAFSEDEKKKCYELALEVREQALNGEAFESLIEKYSDDSQGTLSFGKGELESGFESAAFNLGKDEISGVVETSRGYEIIKCITTFNREETDRNKLKIVEKRKDEVFGQEYGSFVDSLAKNLNEELWDSITLIHEEQVTTSNFFEVYREYFERSE